MLLGFAGAFFAGLERRPPRSAADTVARILRSRAWLALFSAFTCRATFFLAAAVSIEKPFSASGAWSFKPAKSQSAATLRRSAAGAAVGGFAGKGGPGRASGGGGLERGWRREGRKE